MTKKLTKAEIEKMQTYSIRSEQYVRLDDVQAALEARDEDKADGKGDVARPAASSGDKPARS